MRLCRPLDAVGPGRASQGSPARPFEGDEWELVVIAIEEGSRLTRQDIQPALDTGLLIVDKWFLPI